MSLNGTYWKLWLISSKNFDERNVDEMLVKRLFLYAYFAWWLYLERLKFGDLTPIRQSSHSSKFLVLRYYKFIGA